MFLLFNKFSQLILWETYGGQSGEWRLKAWEAPVDFALSFLIVFIFAKYIGFIFSEKSKLHDYPDFFLVSIQRYYFLLWIDIAPCQRAKVLVVSIANDKVHSDGNVETLRQGSREKTSVRTSSFAYVSRKDLERDNPKSQVQRLPF